MPSSSFALLSSAQLLGDAVAGQHPLGLDDFVADIEAGGPLLDVFKFCWALRRNPRTRREWSTVINSVYHRPRPRYCDMLLKEAYNLYKMMRQRAGPRLPMPTSQHSYRGYVPRKLARVLRHHGMVGFTQEARQSQRTRAAETVANTWDTLPEQRVVVWMDNYYRARYLNNPARGYSSLNSSVMALLPLPSLPPTAPDFPYFHDVIAACAPTATSIMNVRDAFQALITLTANRRHLPGEIRVPLDVQRPAVRSLPWTPFNLSEVCVSSQEGLLCFLRFAGHVAHRTSVASPPS